MMDTTDEESSVGNLECVKIPSEEYSVLRQERAILREIRNNCSLTHFIFGIGGETTL